MIKKNQLVALFAGVVMVIGVMAWAGSGATGAENLFSSLFQPKPMVMSSADYYVGGSIYYGEEDNRTVLIQVDQSNFVTKDENGNDTIDVSTYFGPASEDFGFTISDEGLVSLYMTPSYYALFESKMSGSVVSSLTEMIQSQSFPYVTDITWNSGFTKISIEVDQALYAELIQKGVLTRDDAPGAASLAACIYQNFTPQGVTGCRVNVIDDKTGVQMGSFMFPSDLEESSPAQ